MLLFASRSTAQVRGTVSDEFQGEGTELKPYLIQSAADLRKLADDVEKGMTYREEFFLLTNNIMVNNGVLDENGNLNEENSKSFEEWKPIGTEKTHFCGTLDGDHHSIYGLYINHEGETPKGLFAYLSGTVKNLAIRDSYFGSNSTMGSVAGIAETITINNKDYIPNISYCLNFATIEAAVYSSNKNGFCCGGICGEMDKGGSVSKCANWGHISGFREKSASYGLCLGGIIGEYYIPFASDKYKNFYDIFDCCNFGTVEYTGFNNGTAGGIIGEINNGYTSFICAWKFDIGALEADDMDSHINNCVNHATIQSISNKTGGIGGGMQWCCIDGCVNYGDIQCEARNNDNTEGYGAISGGYNKSHFIQNCAYLETTCDIFSPSFSHKYTYSDAGNNKVLTRKEMKQQSFLDELNANAKRLGRNYSQWKFGSDGFPTLAWVDNELANSISNIPFTDKTIQNGTDKNIYNLNGQLIRSNTTDTEGLPRGLYIIGGKKIAVK